MEVGHLYSFLSTAGWNVEDPHTNLKGLVQCKILVGLKDFLHSLQDGFGCEVRPLLEPYFDITFGEG